MANEIGVFRSIQKHYAQIQRVYEVLFQDLTLKITQLKNGDEQQNLLINP